MAGDPLTEARFWAQVMTDACRTVFCPPDLESRCKGFVDARGLGGLITVVPHSLVPPNVLVVVDRNAVEAEQRQRRQRGFRFELAVDAALDFKLATDQLVAVAGMAFGDLERIKLGILALAMPSDDGMAEAIARWEDDGGSCR